MSGTEGCPTSMPSWWAAASEASDADSLRIAASAGVSKLEARGLADDATAMELATGFRAMLMAETSSSGEGGEGAPGSEACWPIAAIGIALVEMVQKKKAEASEINTAETAEVSIFRRSAFVRRCVHLFASALYDCGGSNGASWAVGDVPSFRGSVPHLLPRTAVGTSSGVSTCSAPAALQQLLVWLVGELHGLCEDDSDGAADADEVYRCVLKMLIHMKRQRALRHGEDMLGSAQSVVDGILRHIAVSVAPTAFARAAEANTSVAPPVNAMISREQCMLASVIASAQRLCMLYHGMVEHEAADKGVVMRLLELSVLSSSLASTVIIETFFAQLLKTYAGWVSPGITPPGRKDQMHENGRQAATEADVLLRIGDLNRLLSLCSSCPTANGGVSDGALHREDCFTGIDELAVNIVSVAIKRALGAGHAAVSETVGCLHRCMRLLTAQPPKIGAKFHKVICEVLRPGGDTWCLVLEMAVASKAAALAGDEDQIRAIDLLLSIAHTRDTLCGDLSSDAAHCGHGRSPGLSGKDRSRRMTPSSLVHARRAIQQLSLCICAAIIELASTRGKSGKGGDIDIASRKLQLLKLALCNIAESSDFLTMLAIESVIFDCSFLLSWFCHRRGHDDARDGRSRGGGTRAPRQQSDMELLEKFIPPEWLAALGDGTRAPRHRSRKMNGCPTKMEMYLSSARLVLPTVGDARDRQEGALGGDRWRSSDQTRSGAHCSASGADLLQSTVTVELTGMLSLLIHVDSATENDGKAFRGAGAIDRGRGDIVPSILQNLHARLICATGMCLPGYKAYQDVLPRRPSMQSHMQFIRVHTANPFILRSLRMLAKAAPSEVARAQPAKEMLMAMLADLIGRCRFASHAGLSIHRPNGLGSDGTESRDDSTLVEDSITLMSMLAELKWIPAHLSTCYIRLLLLSSDDAMRVDEEGRGHGGDGGYGDGSSVAPFGDEATKGSTLTAKEMQILLSCAWKCCMHLSEGDANVGGGDANAYGATDHQQPQPSWSSSSPRAPLPDGTVSDRMDVDGGSLEAPSDDAASGRGHCADGGSYAREDVWQHEDWQSALRAVMLRRASSSGACAALFAMMPSPDG